MYADILRIQKSINVNHLKQISKSIDYIKIQTRVNDLRKAMMPLYDLKLNEIKSVSKYFSNMPAIYQISINKNFIEGLENMKANLNCVLSSYNNVFNQVALYMAESFKQVNDLYEKCLFLKIADEIGFPLYMEVDSELQDRLIYSYRKNENQCNKKEMSEIILDYYNENYIDHILNGIKNVHVFNAERVILIEEGIETYQLGLYGSSASLFATQLSGMIRDVYEELTKFHRISNKEKKELLIAFNQNCTPDSEKGMLLQIIDSQSQGFIVWHKVIQHFLDIVYSSNEGDMAIQPQRHMICHGKQTNYNTKEMNIKLILCMDIIAELAWRVKNMKEEYSKMIIDV